MNAELQQIVKTACIDNQNERDPTYFSYYAQFLHQQNMLQDPVRTSLYQTSILSNSADLMAGRTVMDLGAGSGILSFFAVRAGAEKVYAIEASGMADKIQKIMDHTNTCNKWLHGKIQVIKGKIENIQGLPLVDTLISEPIGVLLVHERMLESYIVARDRFLKPGGAMIPSMGTIYLAPFSNSTLWSQTMEKVRFWEQKDFYGVDFSPLAKDAKNEIFGQPVVGSFESQNLLSPAFPYTIDFKTVTKEEIQNFVIPFTWVAQYTGLVHGIAAWFDITIGGYILSTSPHAEETHWHQVRMLLKEPLAVNAFETINGWLSFAANPMRSYDIVGEIVIGDQPLSDPHSIVELDSRNDPSGFTRRTGKWALHEQTYYIDQAPLNHMAKPEYSGLYQAE